MKKDYQTKNAPRATTEEVVLPASVTLAMAELADSVREGLLALAVGAGLQDQPIAFRVVSVDRRRSVSNRAASAGCG